MEFLVQNDARYPRRESVLKDKKVLFCGDSICSAAVYDYKDCPYCKKGRKIDALVNSHGYSSL